MRPVKLLRRRNGEVFDNQLLSCFFRHYRVYVDNGMIYCSMLYGKLMGELEEVTVMGVVKKEWWARIRIRIDLDHRVQRWNLDYPVKGLIHNGAVRSFFFFARRACFVRDEQFTIQKAGPKPRLFHPKP